MQNMDSNIKIEKARYFNFNSKSRFKYVCNLQRLAHSNWTDTDQSEKVEREVKFRMQRLDMFRLTRVLVSLRPF